MRSSFALVLALASSPALAAPITVDGTRDANYGSALAVQTVETSGGDNDSELDAAYATTFDRRLFLLFTGNLNDNFDKLEIFIDSKTGGQSTFDSAGNDGAAAMDGMVFDDGFTADFHLIATRGTVSGDPQFNLDFADLGAQTSSHYVDTLTSGSTEGPGGVSGLGVNSFFIFDAYLNTNAAGVSGGMAAANQSAAAAVTTGFELSIDLNDLDYAGGMIRVLAGINGDDHDSWYNQFLGGVPAPQGSLGDGAVDFTGLAGDQFFTVVPEPSGLSCVLFAAVGFLATRKQDANRTAELLP